jgi:hypothetical protein
LALEAIDALELELTWREDLIAKQIVHGRDRMRAGLRKRSGLRADPAGRGVAAGKGRQDNIFAMSATLHAYGSLSWSTSQSSLPALDSTAKLGVFTARTSRPDVLATRIPAILSICREPCSQWPYTSGRLPPTFRAL